MVLVAFSFHGVAPFREPHTRRVVPRAVAVVGRNAVALFLIAIPNRKGPRANEMNCGTLEGPRNPGIE
jgi:hypothetical protein